MSDLHPIMDAALRAAQLTMYAVESVIIGRDIPNRLVRADLECSHLDPDADSTDGVPCGWVGSTDVAVFDDTREALWWCPENHENSERYGDYS